ncbi:unnamed protein product [marine sediment metagenome]|uniref:Uncharacterized protein n=1 Tax=marine sediment metagenome TaxID=412755 RepID=X1IRN5_9ZZZZ
MAEKKLQRQRPLDPKTLADLKEKEDDEIPERGTGRRSGTAKKPTGPKDRLTKEERKERHKKKVG